MVTHAFPGVRQAFDSAYIDPIIWTLEVEIKFYLVVFTAILIVPTGMKLRATSIGAGIGLCSLTAYLAAPSILANHPQLLQLLSDAQFISFIFIGAVFFAFWSGDCSKLELLMRTGVVFSLFALAWIVAERKGLAMQSLSRIWSYAFAVAVFAISLRFSERFELKNTVADFYAAISYPLYVVHLAFGYLILFLLHQTSLPIIVDVAAAFGASTLIAFILHVGIEAPSMAAARLYRQTTADYANLRA
jgi:peptidoglycan/LPS O-acetylase OafA/YrhL